MNVKNLESLLFVLFFTCLTNLPILSQMKVKTVKNQSGSHPLINLVKVDPELYNQKDQVKRKYDEEDIRIATSNQEEISNETLDQIKDLPNDKLYEKLYYSNIGENENRALKFIEELEDEMQSDIEETDSEIRVLNDFIDDDTYTLNHEIFVSNPENLEQIKTLLRGEIEKNRDQLAKNENFNKLAKQNLSLQLIYKDELDISQQRKLLLNKRISYNCYYADSEDDNSYFRYKTIPILREVVSSLGKQTSKRIENTMEAINYHYQHRALIAKRLDSYGEFRDRLSEKIEQLSESSETIQLVNEFEVKPKSKDDGVKVNIDTNGVVQVEKK